MIESVARFPCTVGGIGVSEADVIILTRRPKAPTLIGWTKDQMIGTVFHWYVSVLGFSCWIRSTFDPDLVLVLRSNLWGCEPLVFRSSSVAYTIKTGALSAEAPTLCAALGTDCSV